MYTPLGRPPGQTPPRQTPLPPEMATAADSKHPTGMHSCCLWNDSALIHTTICVENEDILLHSIDLLPLCWLIIETFVVRNTEPVIASHSGRLLVAIFRSRYISCPLLGDETASESRILLKHSD